MPPRPPSSRVVRLVWLSILLVLALPIASIPVHAQRQEPALTEAEIEQLRESAYVPSDRIIVFVKLLDSRTRSLQDLFAKPRRPGREQDVHDLLEQFTAIADELDDNLGDYGPRHRDIRKALPKLIEATERWASAIKSPPDDAAYGVSRKLALESIRDIREAATKLVEEQKTWFADHPPPKENRDVVIPR
jgi:hypothetical protein